MFFNKFQIDGNDYNDCIGRGSCSTSPEVRSLQEIILTFLRQLAYYELKLEEINASYYENEDTVINGILMIIAAGEYSSDQLLSIISKIYSKLLYARKEYIDFCIENNLECNSLKFELKLSGKMRMPEIIKAGEKLVLLKSKRMTSTQKSIYDILILVIKSVCTNLTRLKEYNKFDVDVYKNILKALNLLNNSFIPLKDIQTEIEILVKCDVELIRMVSTSQEEMFGNMSKVGVSLSAEAGKAILASGNNLENLYKLLKSAQNTEINIYTHSDLLIAHSFEKFRKMNSLKGHFGSSTGNCILDFARFPGVIFLTKNYYPNVEYLYRGKIYSAEEPVQNGVIPIKNDNFTPLFEAAVNAKGFTKTKQLKPVTVGYDSDYLEKKLNEIKEKIESNEIEHLVIVGISELSISLCDYFERLEKLLPRKTYVISFSYRFKTENQLHLNIVNNLPSVYKILKLLFEKVPVNSEKLAFLFTKCDVNSISNIINLSLVGVKNIFLTQCQPYVINPNIISMLKSIYGIIPTSSPSVDIKYLHRE